LGTSEQEWCKSERSASFASVILFGGVGIELLLNRKAAKPFARLSCVDCPLGEAQIYFVVQARIRIAARSSKYSCPSARSNPIAAGARRRTDFASE